MSARVDRADVQRARDALSAINPSCDRDTWVKAGMAAKAAGLSWDDFDRWSSRGENYGGRAETRQVWNSFRSDGGITEATLFALAKMHGWSGGTHAPSAPRGRRPHLVPVPSMPRHQAIPAEAPPPPRVHPKHGAPADTWTYRNAEGSPLFHVWRFEKGNGAKEFVPLTFDGKSWVWKSLESPRPLYGLDRLAASPEAVVIVCEGEKAADAAEKLITGCVAVTSPNGAQSAAKADWSPLRARRVILWPDFDVPGEKYARAVAEHASKAGANVVGMVNVRALVSGRNLPEGWDAADALSEGVPPRAADDLPKLPIGSGTPELDPGPLSEDALAQAFEERYAEKLRYCHTSGSWYQWTGTRWQQERTQLAFNWAREICRELGNGEAKFAKAVTAHAVERFASASRLFAVTADQWDRDPWLIATPGGTVDLRDGKLREAVPSEHITKQAGATPAPAGAIPARGSRSWKRLPGATRA